MILSLHVPACFTIVIISLILILPLVWSLDNGMAATPPMVRARYAGLPLMNILICYRSVVAYHLHRQETTFTGRAIVIAGLAVLGEVSMQH